MNQEKKRHPYQANHSLRKWFKTRCEIGGMKPINVETLLSPQCRNKQLLLSSEIQPNHEKTISTVQDFLIIGEEHRLKKQVLELKEKSKDSDLIIKAKLSEKEKEYPDSQT